MKKKKLILRKGKNPLSKKPVKVSSFNKNVNTKEGDFKFLDEYDPLLRPIASLPVVPNSFYFEEFFNWMYDQTLEKISDDSNFKDFVFRHRTLIPEIEIEKSSTKKSFDTLNLRDLSLSAKISSTSSPHQVFLLLIIESISKFPEEFISTFAKIKGFSSALKFDNEFKGQLKCLDSLIQELKSEKNNKNSNLIPILYSYRKHGIVMTAYIEKREEIDIELYPGFAYEFIFSKYTTDTFLSQIIKVLQERKKNLLRFVGNNFKSNVKIYKDDDRIACKATKEEIQNYFLKLNHKDELGVPYMTLKEIKDFLHSNFIVFDPISEKKKFDLKLDKGIIQHFIYLFYDEYAMNKHQADLYALLIKTNFSSFEVKPSIRSIKANFYVRPEGYPTFLD